LALISRLKRLSISTRQMSFIPLVKKENSYVNLTNIPSLNQKKKKILGRGGKGRTGGRGRKGWKMRHGKATPLPAFAGGQSTLIKRLPKIGVQKRAVLFETVQNLRPLSLDTLQHWIDTKRLDPSKPITIKELAKSGIAGKFKDGVKLDERVFYFWLKGSRFFTAKVDLQCNQATQGAIEAIERNGGKFTSIYCDKKRLDSLLHPEKYLSVPDFILPPTKRLIAYYSDPVFRGYLVPLLETKEPNDPNILGHILRETNQSDFQNNYKGKK
jgi:large subunit ribosomal protein L15